MQRSWETLSPSRRKGSGAKSGQGCAHYPIPCERVVHAKGNSVRPALDQLSKPELTYGLITPMCTTRSQGKGYGMTGFPGLLCHMGGALKLHMMCCNNESFVEASYAEVRDYAVEILLLIGKLLMVRTIFSR